MIKWLLALAMAGVSMVGTTASFAQDAAERAGQLKTWREQCSDPDPDLRLAYIEAAIASGDAAVIRICVRQSLESDDADIRNLGLRAALASIDQLVFETTMPPDLADAIKKAGDDQKKLGEISKWYIMRDWMTVQTGFPVEIEGADVTSGKSTWYTLAGRSSRADSYSGKATVIGDKVNWVGSAQLSYNDCRMSLALTPGGELAGTLQCGQLPAIGIKASLL